MVALASRIFQHLFVFSCLTFLGMIATEQNVISVKDEGGNIVSVKYEADDCYRDDPERSLRNLYFNARGLINWSIKPNFTNVIRACAENAYRQGYKTLFGIQHYGECWSDGSPEQRYNMYDKSSNCEYGVGKGWANMVYRLSVIPKSPAQTCNINGKEYSEGAEMLIPNDWTSDVGNARCMKCRCAGGQAEDCKIHMYCDIGFHGLCSKWRNATGECCPVCDCYHDGKVMELGSTWVVREGSQCSECTCGENKVAKCTSQSTCICFGQSIPVPGKCCPKCVPITTTSPPPETLPTQTERPPPTFPPFPMP